MAEPTVLCWSGGKDSALALQALQQDAALDPVVLLVTITQPQDRVSMHGVRRELIEEQARALGLPLRIAIIPAEASNEIYVRSMEAALLAVQAEFGVTHMAFGDLFLEDIRRWRVEQFAHLPLKPVFPVWGRDTRQLAEQFIADGFRTILVCIDPRKLDAAFAGREYDHQLLADLPEEIDPCGENGEFHTFVHDGPLFSHPVACRVGPQVAHGGFIFRELTP